MLPLYRDIRAKQEIMRDRYGGMMTIENIMTELGYKSRKSAVNAVKELAIPATRVGKMKKYETDVVAKRLVELRGMC